MTKQGACECAVLGGLAVLGVGAYLQAGVGVALMLIGGIILIVGAFGFFWNLSGRDSDGDGS